MLDLREAVKEKSILIVGTARNVEGAINQTIAKLINAFSSFKNLSWLIVESDSSDNTITALQKLSANIPNFRYISKGLLQETMLLRTERLAACRNEYLKEIRENPLYSHIDYVVIADLDGVNNLLTPEAVISCWTNSDWDVLTANQAGPYYDIWALRHKTWCPNDCFEQFRLLVDRGAEGNRALFTAVYSKMVNIPGVNPCIPVESAFGGLAIYRREALMKGSYAGLNSRGEEVCEHTTLHKTLIEGGYKIFINPALINTDYTDHTMHMKPVST